ncbi:MAG: hypothetical protein ACR2FM_00295 [Candidatus Saccharimonadales bacterium]
MTIKRNYLSTKNILLAVFCLLSVVLCVQAFSGHAYAAVKNEAQIAAAAKAKCGGGEAVVPLNCRKGYKLGYASGSDVGDKCDGGSNAAQDACKKGYDYGQKQRTLDGPLSGGGPNGDGSPPGGGSGADAAGGSPDAPEAYLTPRNASEDGGQCGNSQAGGEVKTRFNFGCIGNDGPANMGAIEDMTYAFIRFLSYGVGIIIVFSIIMSGIQYSASEGNAEATQAAKGRIQNAVVGLFFYLFSFALVQFLVPGGVFSATIIVPDMIINNLRIE